MQHCSSKEYDKAAYQHRLRALVSEQYDGPPGKWPDEADYEPPMAHYSASGVFADTAELIIRAARDRENRTRAICVIEGINPEYASELGVAWNLDPRFFAEHLKPLKEAVAVAALVESRSPNSEAGLKSDQYGLWGTIRGIIDHGKLPDDENGMTLEEPGNRTVMFSHAHIYASHTNISFYKVDECLDIVLVDQLPPYHYDFEIDSPAWLPNQSVLYVATVDGLRHLAIPQLLWTKCTGVWSMWALFFEHTNLEVLLQSIRHEGFDGFMYKASGFECERHLNLLGQELRRFNYDEIYNGGMETNRKLHGIRKCLYRLKSCIDENVLYEERVQRTAAFKADLNANNRTTLARRDFEKLAVDIGKLERLLESCFQLLMSTMNAKNSEIMRELGEANREQTLANRQQTEAMVEQTHTMTMLSWLAFLYIPMTLATGVFGMNLKEINDSPLSLWHFGAVAVAVLISAIAFIKCYRALQRASNRGSTNSQDGDVWGLGKRVMMFGTSAWVQTQQATINAGKLASKLVKSIVRFSRSLFKDKRSATVLMDPKDERTKPALRWLAKTIRGRDTATGPYEV